MKKNIFLIAFIALVWTTGGVFAQQKIAYIRSEFILGKLPEYASVQQKLDRLTQDWEGELRRKKQENDELFREYQARELLYTPENRNAKRQEIIEKERTLEDLRRRYFGPEGELFKQQEGLMKPIQERVLTAVEKVAQREGYDYVFDKNGDFVFVFTKDQFDLSELVLKELGIDLRNINTQSRPNRD
ncbi:MAG TPA: hypothetical protein DIW24_10195 [Bacteroidetes bacterium]|nr:hypothetical protein [Bacteroidota bacterium]HRR07096.1 OmpH family outer membrane protein [Rhodothermales bacterium]